MRSVRREFVASDESGATHKLIGTQYFRDLPGIDDCGPDARPIAVDVTTLDGRPVYRVRRGKYRALGEGGSLLISTDPDAV